MKKLKTSVSLILALILALTVTSAAFADGDAGKVVLSGTAGEGITWTLTDKGLLTVSGNGEIKDDVDYDYDDDGEITGWTVNRSIGMSINDYIDGKTADLGAEEAARTLLNTVKEIVIENGITAIPDGEFDNFYPRKITLPSTLEKIGYNSFSAMLAEEVVIPCEKIKVIQFSIPAYRTGSKPYGSLDEAVEGFVQRRVNEEKFFADIAPYDILREIYGLRNGIYKYDENEMEQALKNFNEALGTEYDNLDDIAADALNKVNKYFGTRYTKADEVFYISEGDFGPEVCAVDEIQSKYDEKINEVFNEDRFFAADFYEKPDEEKNLYNWLTVYGIKGSEIETKCGENGVKFVAVDSDDGSALWKFFGNDLSGDFLQKILGAIHTVLYFFAHLFGLMP